MKRKAICILLTSALTAAFLAGCGSSGNSSGSSASSANTAEAVETAETTKTEEAPAENSGTAQAEDNAVVLGTDDTSKLKAYDFDLSVLGDTPATKLDDAVKDGDFVVALSDSFSGNSWRQQFEKEFEAAAEKYKQEGYISDYVILDAGGDQTKQVSDIEDLITQGVDAIVVDAITDVALNDVLQEAQDAGILVLNCDNLVTTDVTSKIIVSDYDFGYTGGSWLGEQLGGKGGKVVVLDGTAGSSTDTNRHNGMVDGLKASNPSAEIVAQQNADWDYATASTAMGTILSANPEIDGVLSQGGAMTMAAIDAFVAADRKLVPMTGEASNGFLRMWSEYKDQGFSSIAFANPPFQSVMCLNLAINKFNGVEIAPTYQLNIPSITDDMIDRLYDSDLSDSFWVFSTLSEDQVKELFAE